jgi:hypothetical protein
MLDPWIIEEIRRREREEEARRQERRPVLEIQIETPRRTPDKEREEQPGNERGVAIIDFRIF